jgi:elongation factor G
MKFYNTENIRNIALLGHGGEGKTTLAEAMLFQSGGADRMGRVEEGNTTMDFDPEETKRQISLSTALAPVEWNDIKVNIIDAPGFFDFAGETQSAYYLCDNALILVSALSGLSVGALKAYDYTKKNGIPRAFFINQMDKENVNFENVLNSLKNKFGPAVTPMQLPIGEGISFKGVIDILDLKAYHFDGKSLKSVDMPAELMDRATSIRESIIENAAENDEVLMEKFFGGEELTKEDIIKGLKVGIAAGDTVPVFLGSASQNLGTGLLLDNLVSFMPSPDKVISKKAKNTKTNEDIILNADSKKPFVAQIYKTVADPFVGKLSIFKVLSGEMRTDLNVLNVNKGKSEKFGGIFVNKGKKQINVDKLAAGDIGSIAKLQYTETGDTLSDASYPVVCGELSFPEPCISLAVTAKKQGEEDKVFSGLYKLAEEDPTLTIIKQTETSDTLINGLGELHLEVVCNKLNNKYKVQAELIDPKVPYREAIRKKVQAHGRHKKQSGGHGQFGDCWVEFEPMYDSVETFEFVDKIVGGVVPRQYIPAVEKGLRESLSKGVLAGYPVVNLRATLYDGSYHAVDSSEMAFKIAAHLAFKTGCKDANPVLLEPISKVSVMIPDEYMGDIIGDLNRRRGRILGMSPGDGEQIVEAEVPLSEMFKYATDLRSMTQARGSFKLTFLRYDELPANLAAKVIANAKKEEEEE